MKNKIKEFCHIESKKDWYSKFFIGFYFLFSICLYFINLIGMSKYQILGFILSVIILTLFIFHLKKNKNINFDNKRLLSILFIIPIILRLSLLFLQYGDFVSDYSNFVTNSLNFANLGIVDNEYVSMFPFLYPSYFLFGIVFKKFGTKYFTFILMNIIIELIGIIFFYLTLKSKCKKDVAIKTTLLYLYNPISILFITLCCPVIVVNTLLIITIYVFTKIDFNKKYIIPSIITGIFIGLTNVFRPIMIIFCISLLIYYLYLLIIKGNWKKVLISFILILFFYISTTNIIMFGIEKSINIPIDGSKSGFSLLMGSNMDSHGMWNLEDSKTFYSLKKEYGNIEAHKKAADLAIERYKSYGVKSLCLWSYKSLILGRNLDSYVIGDTFSFIKNDIPNAILIFIKSITSLFLYLILLINVISSIKLVRSKSELNWLTTIAIFGMGLFVATLFVEASPRYFMPIMVPLLFMSSLIFDRKEEGK